MIFKARYTKQGGHYHVRIFSGQGEGYTFSKLGDLTMDERDMAAFKSMARCQGHTPARDSSEHALWLLVDEDAQNTHPGFASHADGNEVSQ